MFSFLKKKPLRITSPVAGGLVNLDKVADPVFAEGMMGTGFAVQPTSDEIFAPFSGQVTSIFPTKHAIGIKTEDGQEALIHMGLDTVDLQGEGFTIDVVVGDTLANGQKIATIDRQYIQSQGKSDTIIVVFPERQQAIKVTEKQVTANEPIEFQ